MDTRPRPRPARGAATVAVTAILVIVGAWAPGCGSASHRQAPPRSVAPTPAPVPAPPATVPPPAVRPAGPPPLAVGLTESNANLLFSPQARARPPGGFGVWRDRLRALSPVYLRIAVDWAQLQPHRGSAARLDAVQSGCERSLSPCASYRGLADDLAAIASEQRAGLGFEPVLDISGVPAWAARAPSGCERPGTQPGSRPLSSEGLSGYRRLIAAILALGHREGVALRYWSPWNEPNHPYFISPQRARCSKTSPSLSASVYTALVRAMAQQLRSSPGEHHLVLGELANIPAPEPHGTGAAELVGALPPDVVCASRIWSVHDYAQPGVGAPRHDAVAQIERALAARGRCGRRAEIWVTETGEGSPHAGVPRSRDPARWRAGCRAMARKLEGWNRDPRVRAAFQYSFREDPLFAVGLADPRLTGLYPDYYLWRAWARVTSRASPPPLPAECA